MPRYKTQDSFRVGDYWLSKQPRSDAWCRTWFDNKTRQTKRASLRTTDFEDAKQILTDWFILNQKQSKEDPCQKSLADIFANFYEQHASSLKSAYQSQLSLRYWLEFYGERTVEEASDINLQEAFHKWLIEGKLLNPNTVSRIVSIGKTALNWAWKRNMLSSVPYFKAVTRQPAPPRGRPLQIVEIKRLLAHTKSDHMKTFILSMIATTARPDAVLDLTFDRCDYDNCILILNPEGRLQTKKYRPTVKMPELYADYLKELEQIATSEYVVAYHESKISSIKKAWQRLRNDAGLDNQVNAYSLRHTMARWMRSQGVPAWEVSAQLGHKQPDMTTTEIYAPFNPNHLSNAVEAINTYLSHFACEIRVNNTSSDIPGNSNFPYKSKGKMVGDTGIEPVTPTMSM